MAEWTRRLRNTPLLRGHIGRQMALLIIAFSSLVTLIITLFQLGMEYRELRTGIERRLDEVAVYSESIAGSVWQFDERQIQVIMEGILRLPDVERVTITMTDTDRSWSAGKSSSSSVVTRHYGLHVATQTAEIGAMEVVASLDAVNKQIFSHAIVIFLSNGLKTLCVALFMLYIFRHLVSKRLTALTRKVHALGPELFPTMNLALGDAVKVPEELDELAAVDWLLDRTAEELKRAAEERLSAETEVLELSVRLQALLDAAVEVAVISTDPEGRIVVFNRGAERMLGYDAQEMLGKSPAVFHRDSEVKLRARALSKELGRTIEGFETFVALARNGIADTRNWTYLTKSGQILRVSLAITAVRDAAGTLIGFLGIARDVGAQLAAEADLVKANLHLESRVRERTEDLQASTQQLQVTLDDLRQTQGQLVQAEKLASLGSLVAAVAHELNTPIGNCLTTASAMHDKTVAFEESLAGGALRRSTLDQHLVASRQAMDILTRGLERCATLVANFKQVAANTRGMDRREFLLDELLAGQLEQQRIAAKNLTHQLRLSCPPNLTLDSYPEAIEKIVAHIVSNAFTHAFADRDHGVLAIEVVADDDDSVRLSFSDDGKGMPEEIRKHVFDPFFTTQLGKGGSGLGMCTVYNLATGPLAGTIGIASSVGKGSTYTLTIPRVAPTTRLDT